MSSTVMAVWYRILVQVGILVQGWEVRNWGSDNTWGARGSWQGTTAIAPPPPGNTLGLKERRVLEWLFPADDLQMPLEAFHQRRLGGGVHLIAKAPAEVCQAKVATSSMYSHQENSTLAKKMRNFLLFFFFSTNDGHCYNHYICHCSHMDGEVSNVWKWLALF